MQENKYVHEQYKEEESEYVYTRPILNRSIIRTSENFCVLPSQIPLLHLRIPVWLAENITYDL